MVVNKYLILGILVPMLISISFSLNWNVLDTSNGILVYGYINENSQTSINLKVIDGSGNVIFDGQPTFSSDYDTDTIMAGAFYQEINLDSGNYIVEVEVGDQTYSKNVEFHGITPFVTPKIVDISQNDENTIVYVNITNDGKSDYNGNLTVYYRNGYSKIKVNVSAMSSKLVNVSIPTNEFGKNTVAIAQVEGVDYKLFKNGEQTLPKDFEIETKDISIVRGKSGEFSFDIKNLDNYSINLNIEYDSNLDVNGEQEITLQPNEEVEVSYFVSVPRDFNDTPYLKINIFNGEYEKEKEVNVNILPFEGFDLSINLGNYLPGNEINTKAIVENIGDEKKDIQFSYEVFGQKYIYPYKVSLSPGESFSFPVNILIPNDQTTDFDVKFFVNDEEFDKTVEVTPYMHDFSINVNQSELNILAGQNEEISLTIKNDGNINDNYKISVNGWKYYTLDRNEISVAPGEEKRVTLDIITNKDMNMGNYKFNISVSNGVYTKYENIDLSINKPENEQSNISFVGKDVQKFSTNKTFNYTLNIKNLGIAEKEYLIEVSDFNITKDVYLLPNESKEVQINVTPNEARDYNFNITVFSNGVKIWNKELTLEYVEKNKVTGAFIMAPKEASIIGLVALAILGGAALGLYIGEKVKIKVNREKAVVSNDYR